MLDLASLRRRSAQMPGWIGSVDGRCNLNPGYLTTSAHTDNVYLGNTFESRGAEREVVRCALHGTPQSQPNRLVQHG